MKSRLDHYDGGAGGNSIMAKSYNYIQGNTFHLELICNQSLIMMTVVVVVVVIILLLKKVYREALVLELIM